MTSRPRAKRLVLLLLLPPLACKPARHDCFLSTSLTTNDGAVARCRILVYAGAGQSPARLPVRADGEPIEIPVPDVPSHGSCQVVFDVDCDGYQPLRSGPHVVGAGRFGCGNHDVGTLRLRRNDSRAALDAAPRK